MAISQQARKKLARKAVIIPVLLVAGAVILGIGVFGLFNGGQSTAQEPADQGISIQEVDNPPVGNPDNTPSAPAIAPPQVSALQQMVIESIGVDAPVKEMGVDGQGVPEVPRNGQDVAWYNFSSAPGAGSNAVFGGHVTWKGRAVFADVDSVQVGDTIRLIFDGGREYVYEVFANFFLDPTDPDSVAVMYPTPTDTVTIITCGGTFIPDASNPFGGDYTSRTIVQAKLLQSSVGVPVPAASSVS